MVPPPIPVTVPSSTKPTTSIWLRDATSAPVIVNATMPSQSRIAMPLSNKPTSVSIELTAAAHV
jgi:hypothetical protein